MRNKIPRDNLNDYTLEIVKKRQAFLAEQTGVVPEHIKHFSFDLAATRGNIENLTGVAQVPLGFAGPLLVNGEHAKGEFFVPMATTEGTLLASYNRGMRLIHDLGGVTVTVVDDAMQRAPVFGFAGARQANHFSQWIKDNFTAIKTCAETTTAHGKLRDIEHYPVSRFLHLRFNFTTGDAAGQNLTGKATWAACKWIQAEYSKIAPIKEFSLSGNMDTDKKASLLNTLHTRGKKVVAEVLITNRSLQRHLHVNTKEFFQSRLRANLGTAMAGSVNNGSHSANAIAAIFIATGQDVANIAESHTALVYSEIVDTDDLYYSITLPSLIVATTGGGTGLPTQKECLQILDCYGTGKVKKLAEIVAGTVLCGELSLGAAVVGGYWVDAHEKLGRNRT
jgi:hydroxymethylglutaryl-CoA reductase (NADPH)